MASPAPVHQLEPRIGYLIWNGSHEERKGLWAIIILTAETMLFFVVATVGALLAAAVVPLMKRLSASGTDAVLPAGVPGTIRAEE